MTGHAEDRTPRLLLLQDLFINRSYIWRTALADVRHRYAGSAAGVMWNVLQPLALILVFSVIFTQVIDRAQLTAEQIGAGNALDGIGGGSGGGSGGDGVAYPIYLCSALLPWLAFAECLSRGTASLTESAGLLRRLAVPESVFVAKAAVSSLIGLTISMGLFVPIAVFGFGLAPDLAWLLLPIPLVLLIVLGFGVSLALSPLHALLRDTATLLTVVLQVGFWCYPVVYERSFLPAWADRLLVFNPVFPFLESIREIVLMGRVPSVGLWAGMVGWAVAACAIGYAVLRSLRSSVRDAA
jgi:homopolymeric O-antigen transport system permease protein